MLSRSAEGIYWMGRYMERTQSLCRLLRLQAEALADRPVREIYFGWRRLYSGIGREPPGGSLVISDDDNYTLADSYTLADDLTFERANPSSVWSCFSMVRENARQMRHRISGEMWTSLNLAYLRVQRIGIQDIWTGAPETFYADLSREIDTFRGVAESTMYRDEGWSFLRLGSLIERSQLMTALLLVQMAGSEDDDASAVGWTTLLRSHHALDAYSRRHGVEVHPVQALDLLVTDPALPTSLCGSLDAAELELAGCGPGPDTAPGLEARRLAARVREMVRYEWPDGEGRHEFLFLLRGHCLELHNLVAAAYFHHWPN